MRRSFHSYPPTLTFVTIKHNCKEVQYNIVPKRIDFNGQNWILTFKNVSKNRMDTVPMTKVSKWIEILNEDIKTPGRVY